MTNVCLQPFYSSCVHVSTSLTDHWTNMSTELTIISKPKPFQQTMGLQWISGLTNSELKEFRVRTSNLQQIVGLILPYRFAYAFWFLSFLTEGWHGASSLLTWSKQLLKRYCWYLQAIFFHKLKFQQAERVLPFLGRFESAWPAEMEFHTVVRGLRRAKASYHLHKSLKSAAFCNSSLDRRGSSSPHISVHKTELAIWTCCLIQISSKIRSLGTVDCYERLRRYQWCLRLWIQVRHSNASWWKRALISCFQFTTLLGAHTLGGLSAFLSSLKLNLVELTPTFLHAGISDEECFRAVVELPEKERDTFVDELQLNLLQSRMVKRGLRILKSKMWLWLLWKIIAVECDWKIWTQHREG